MGMPILAQFLERRGESLQVIAVDAMLAAAGTRALSLALSEEAARLGEMSAEEAAEGYVRLAASAGLAAGSEELAMAGADLAAVGLDEVDEAREVLYDAGELAAEGVEELAAGAAELGAAAVEETEEDE
jgi:hypothetical protein